MSSDESQHTPAVAADEKKSNAQVRVQEVEVRPRLSSSGSSKLSIQTPRTARFAEATSVNSPVSPTRRNPFTGPSIDTTHIVPEAQVADVGFGYMSSSDRLKHTSVEMPLTPREPLKSALKTPGTLKAPGTPGRFLDPRSPTFKEEVALEKEELKTEKSNAADLVRSPLWPLPHVRHLTASCRKSRSASALPSSSCAASTSPAR